MICCKQKVETAFCPNCGKKNEEEDSVGLQMLAWIRNTINMQTTTFLRIEREHGESDWGKRRLAKRDKTLDKWRRWEEFVVKAMEALASEDRRQEVIASLVNEKK